MSFNGELYLPIYQSFSEKELGGSLEIEADFTDPFVQSLVLDSGGWMLWPPVRFRYDTIDYHLPGAAPAGLSWRHPLGTDDGAKDTLARLL